MPFKKKPFKKTKKKSTGPTTDQPIRVKTPRDNETIGVVLRRLGGSRMEVSSFDGKSRICRIPGKLKKFLWIREGDTVLVKPWEFQGDIKGDVIYKYHKNQVLWLKRKGYIKEVSEFEEF